MSDGSSLGTWMLRDVAMGSSSGFGPAFPAGDSVYFFFATPDTGLELWRSDGTIPGTHLLKDIYPGPPSAFFADPNDPTIIEGGLVTDADDGVHGRELWWSDGTEAGTIMADINPGPASSHPLGYVRSGEWIYFSADDGLHGREVWALPLACVQSSRYSR